MTSYLVGCFKGLLGQNSNIVNSYFQQAKQNYKTIGHAEAVLLCDQKMTSISTLKFRSNSSPMSKETRLRRHQDAEMSLLMEMDFDELPSQSDPGEQISLLILKLTSTASR